jgi:hypothetical protein
LVGIQKFGKFFGWHILLLYIRNGLPERHWPQINTEHP